MLSRFTLLALVTLSFTGCEKPSNSNGTPKPFILTFLGFREDVRTITVSVPQMGSLDCSQRIQDALSKAEGVRSTKPDIANRKIDITYDAIKLGIMNIEFVIAGAGFDANDTPAAADARNGLPDACR